MNKCCFYGSLRKPMYNYMRIINNHGINSMKYIETITIPGFLLYDTGNGYPAAVRTYDDTLIVVDLFEVNDYAFNNIEYMEILAGYQEDFINIKDDMYSIFTFSVEQVVNCKLIAFGDWNIYLNKSKFLNELNN